MEGDALWPVVALRPFVDRAYFIGVKLRVRYISSRLPNLFSIIRYEDSIQCYRLRLAR